MGEIALEELCLRGWSPCPYGGVRKYRSLHSLRSVGMTKGR